MCEQIRILSANCQGLRNKSKRKDVINYLQGLDPNIICLQDTHLVKSEENELRSLSNCECLISGIKSNSRGVAILMMNNFEYKINISKADNDGNMLYVDIDIGSIGMRLINIYAPNADTPQFFQNVKTLIEENTMAYVVLCGDFNLVLDPKLDSSNYVSINNPKSRQMVIQTLDLHNLKDAFRYFHPDIRRFTWRRRSPIKQARLDYFLVSSAFTDYISSCDIIPGYRSDHSIVKINIQTSKFICGKGLWKFNCALLSNPEYLELINKTIQEVKMEYALPVYSLDFLKNASDSEITFTIEEDLLLEMIIFKIRAKTIKFGSIVKNKNKIKEQNLIKQIDTVEKAESSTQSTELIDNLKKELGQLRETKLKGHMIRSRLQWLHSSEKPSKFFCSLEQKNFIDKTIRKIKLDNGEIVTEQKDILNHVKEYYTQLFRNKDTELTNMNISEIIKHNEIKKLTKFQAEKLEGPIKLSEVGAALKQMKKNKTPGIDGFPAEFFKVFWCKLKFLIVKVFNIFYKKGSLSVTLRQSVITCIPKGDKPRQFLKNWRPISLLCVLYKLLSTVIATRLKTVLDCIISESQSGFIRGRNISDVTRLIYDLMNYTEIHNIDGLLMLIDFEKAFDSVSWKFLCNVLKYLGFTENYIRWINILNYDMRATIVQAGCKSDFFQIERGCKQGDPIAAYLFLLCAQILTYMIKQNPNIKGLFIGKEIKLCQFADDTTLILDGSKESLEAALNTIEIFGSVSGLKMNTTKTKLVWIGKRKHCRDKLNVSSKLEWGTTIFKLLGITFSVNLNEIPSLNYPPALEKSKKILLNWKRRTLSPLGKITVLKTYILSQFIHLFTTLPSPSKEFIKTMNTIFFNFIWDNKPDKVKRIYITQDYQDGGLKMINLEKFIMSIKLTWIRKFFSTPRAEYIPVFEKVLCPLSNFVNLGPDWTKSIALKTTNSFWKEVLFSWIEFIKIEEPEGNTDIMSSPVWYNPLISKNTIFLPMWYKNGITTVGDLVNEDGYILEQNEIEERYNLPKTNFLDYYRVKLLINKFNKTYKKGNNFCFLQPYIPMNLRFLLLNKSGTKGIYKKLNKAEVKMEIIGKWHNDVAVELHQTAWQHKFRICFKTINDPFYKWFQYRVLHRILGTQENLNKMGISDSPNCLLCGENVETLIHLFVLCTKSKVLWCQLENCITLKASLQIKFNPVDILLGYRYFNPNSVALNTIIIVTKSYIFSSSRKGQELNLNKLLGVLKQTYNEQKLVESLEMKDEKLEISWHKIKRIFDNDLPGN